MNSITPHVPTRQRDQWHEYKGRHRKPNRRRKVWLPLWAGALLLALQGMREMNEATAAQPGRYAQDGAT